VGAKWRVNGVGMYLERSCNDAQRNRFRVRHPCRFMTVLVMAICVVALASCSGSSDPIQTVRHESVLFVPPIEAGDGGWCLAIQNEACRGIALQGPIIAEGWVGYGPPPTRIGIVVTTSAVSAVSVEGGAPIAMRGEEALPDDLRAASVEIQGGRRFRRVPGFGISAPVPASFVPLAQGGKLMHQIRGLRTSLLFVEPTKRWTWPASVPRGICAIRIGRLEGLRVERGNVVTRFEHRVGLVERPLLSCALTVYELNGSSVLASVLVDAGDPGSSPTPLPGMKPLAGHPGVVQAPVADGEAVAHRIPGAWLIVTKGSGVSQRLDLLEHMSAKVHF
jgi:hypothetical protein